MAAVVPRSHLHSASGKQISKKHFSKESSPAQGKAGSYLEKEDGGGGCGLGAGQFSRISIQSS